MSGVNRAVILGRLTADPEVRKTQTGLSVCSFTVAADRIQKAGEEKKADFISCVAWRQSAEYLAQYGRKGNWVSVDGRLQTRTYDKDGRTVYVTEVVADNVSLIGNNNSAQNEQNKPTTYVYDGPATYAEAKAATDKIKEDISEGLNVSAEDLPF